MDNYIKQKLSLKINKKIFIDLDDNTIDKLINKLARDFNGFGKYEIIYQNNSNYSGVWPMSMVKLPNHDVEFRNDRYYLIYPGLVNRMLLPLQYIEFDIQEHREEQLKKLGLNE